MDDLFAVLPTVGCAIGTVLAFVLLLRRQRHEYAQSVGFLIRLLLIPVGLWALGSAAYLWWVYR